MAQYTMTLIDVMEALTGRNSHAKYLDIHPMITEARPLIFDFDYPIFDTDYRIHLETIFLQRFMFHEICDTPVPRWKLYLQNKMWEVMPVLNKYYEAEKLKFDPLTNFKTSREGNRNNNETYASKVNDIFQGVGDTDRTESTDRTERGNTDSLIKQSDTPQSEIEDLLNSAYLSAAEKTDSDTNNTSNEDSSSTVRNTQNDTRDINRDDNRHSLDTYFENLTGYQGVSPTQLLQEYRQSFINVDNMFIKKMSPLFFGLL